MSHEAAGYRAVEEFRHLQSPKVKCTTLYGHLPGETSEGTLQPNGRAETIDKTREKTAKCIPRRLTVDKLGSTAPEAVFDILCGKQHPPDPDAETTPHLFNREEYG
jgi:hypothetical protein